MISLEAAKQVGAVDSFKIHDTKRFRLRAVSNEAEVYERYFHKSVAKSVSWVQLGTAAFTLIAQMTVMFILLDHSEYYNSGTYMGLGIWGSITIIVSSVMTMWAARKPTYGKLHASMALHIISVLAQIIFVLILFCLGIPELRRSIRSIHRGEYTYLYGSVNSEPDVMAFTLRELNAAFALNAMMSFTGIIQILMSFFMSLKTGRAICCGRTHLEGKFLEMEAVGREDADAVVNFRVGSRDRHSATAPGIVPTRTDSVGPPPYDAGLGFFDSPNPNNSNSTDVAN